MAQLAEMGVAIPGEHRPDMALAGDWQVVSQRPVEQDEETGKGLSLNIGIRKRKFDGQEEDEAGEIVKEKGWGSTTKAYPSGAQQNLDALLRGGVSVKNSHSPTIFKQEGFAANVPVYHSAEGGDGTLVATDKVQVKQEDDLRLSAFTGQTTEQNEAASSESPDIVFKKRKSKQIRAK
jgi:hypothetical protein